MDKPSGRKESREWTRANESRGVTYSSMRFNLPQLTQAEWETLHFSNIRLSENGIGLGRTLMDSHPHDFKGTMSKLVITNRNSYRSRN